MFFFGCVIKCNCVSFPYFLIKMSRKHSLKHKSSSLFVKGIQEIEQDEYKKLLMTHQVDDFASFMGSTRTVLKTGLDDNYLMIATAVQRAAIDDAEFTNFYKLSISRTKLCRKKYHNAIGGSWTNWPYIPEVASAKYDAINPNHFVSKRSQISKVGSGEGGEEKWKKDSITYRNDVPGTFWYKVNENDEPVSNVLWKESEDGKRFEEYRSGSRYRPLTLFPGTAKSLQDIDQNVNIKQNKRLLKQRTARWEEDEDEDDNGNMSKYWHYVNEFNEQYPENIYWVEQYDTVDPSRVIYKQIKLSRGERMFTGRQTSNLDLI